jgi:hypothetical protein
MSKCNYQMALNGLATIPVLQMCGYEDEEGGNMRRWGRMWGGRHGGWGGEHEEGKGNIGMRRMSR